METGSILKFAVEKSRLTGGSPLRTCNPDCRLRHNEQNWIVEKDHVFDGVLVICIDGSA